MVVPWFIQNFTGVDGWGLDGWFLLVLMTIFAFWVVHSPELVKYSAFFFERYLVAKIRTIFLILVWMVFFIKRD
jgi:hypothetical protein